MRASIVLPCLFGLAVGLSHAGERDVVKADLERLQGDWLAVRTISQGDASEIRDEKMQVKYGVTFTGTTLTMNGRKGGFTIDPSKKPKVMRFAIMSDDWCYHLDKDTLVIAFGTVGQKSLPDIQGKDGNYVVTFQRKRK